MSSETTKTGIGCDDCTGGWIITDGGVRPCACRQLASERARARKAFEAMDPRFAKADLATMTPRPTQVAARQGMLDDPLAGYLIHGPRGAGKTYLMAGQYRLCATEQLVYYSASDRLIDDLVADAMGTPATVLELVVQPDTHIFIDDFDAIDFSRTSFRQESLFRLIDRLYRNNNTVTLTSGKSLRQLADSGMIDSSIIRRLDEMTRPLPCVRVPEQRHIGENI